MTMKVCEQTTAGEWMSRSIVPTMIDVAPLKPVSDLASLFLDSCITVLDLLDGFLCDEFRAMAVSDQLLEVPFSGIAIVVVMIVLPIECAIFTGIPLSQDLVDRDSKLSEGFRFRVSFLGSRSKLVPIFVFKLVAFLACLPCRVVSLLAGFLRSNTVIVPECVALCRRKDFYQVMASSRYSSCSSRRDSFGFLRRLNLWSACLLTVR
ncbi:unnamed protein product [Prunus brigantina]